MAANTMAAAAAASAGAASSSFTPPVMVDVSSSDRDAWLLRIPGKLALSWRLHVKDDTAPIAIIRTEHFAKGTGLRPRVTLLANKECLGEDAEYLPLTYDLAGIQEDSSACLRTLTERTGGSRKQGNSSNDSSSSSARSIGKSGEDEESRAGQGGTKRKAGESELAFDGLVKRVCSLRPRQHDAAYARQLKLRMMKARQRPTSTKMNDQDRRAVQNANTSKIRSFDFKEKPKEKTSVRMIHHHFLIFFFSINGVITLIVIIIICNVLSVTFRLLSCMIMPFSCPF